MRRGAGGEGDGGGPGWTQLCLEPLGVWRWGPVTGLQFWCQGGRELGVPYSAGDKSQAAAAERAGVAGPLRPRHCGAPPPGLEPEIQKLIAQHKQEVKKLKSLHEAELLQVEARAAQRYGRQVEELREHLQQEKEALGRQERERAQQRCVRATAPETGWGGGHGGGRPWGGGRAAVRTCPAEPVRSLSFEEHVEQEQRALQQQRRRLYSEVAEEKERLGQQAARCPGRGGPGAAAAPPARADRTCRGPTGSGRSWRSGDSSWRRAAPPRAGRSGPSLRRGERSRSAGTRCAPVTPAPTPVPHPSLLTRAPHPVPPALWCPLHPHPPAAAGRWGHHVGGTVRPHPACQSGSHLERWAEPADPLPWSPAHPQASSYRGRGSTPALTALSAPQMEMKALKDQLEVERQTWAASCAQKEVRSGSASFLPAQPPTHQSRRHAVLLPWPPQGRGSRCHRGAAQGSVCLCANTGVQARRPGQARSTAEEAVSRPSLPPARALRVHARPASKLGHLAGGLPP